jgi:hypothetical protein
MINKRLIIILFIFTIINTSAISQNEMADNAVCLELVGVPMLKNTLVDSVDVVLYEEKNDKEMIKIANVITQEDYFVFNLKRDSHYTILISKPGFSKKMISISTKLPKRVLPEPIFKYRIEIELNKEEKNSGKQRSVSQIDLINYDIQKDIFISH